MNMLTALKNKVNWTNINFLLLFLYSLRIFRIQDEILWIWGIVGILYFVIKRKRILLGFQGIVLCVITPIYAFIYKYYFTETRGYTWNDVAYMIFLPIFMYLLSRQLVYKRKGEELEIGLWCVAGGTFLYSLLNHWMYLQYGFTEGPRIWTEFWIREGIYATEASFWGVFITALIGYGFCCFCQKKWSRGIAALLGVLIGNIINIQVGNRMVFMTTFVAAAVSFGMFFILNRKNRKLILRVFLCCCAALLIGGLAVYSNWEKIQQTPYYVNIISRDGGILHNVRFAMIIDTLRQLPYNLIGGGHIYPAGFYAVHNYWLQAANDTGIWTLILWIVYSIVAIVDIIKLLLLKNIDRRIKYMLIPMFVAVVGYMMMEQAGTGKWIYVNFYVMLSAFIHQLVMNEKNENRSGKC